MSCVHTALCSNVRPLQYIGSKLVSMPSLTPHHPAKITAVQQMQILVWQDHGCILTFSSRLVLKEDTDRPPQRQQVMNKGEKLSQQ